jgi:hypothetical protein
MTANAYDHDQKHEQRSKDCGSAERSVFRKGNDDCQQRLTPKPDRRASLQILFNEVTGKSITVRPGDEQS